MSDFFPELGQMSFGNPWSPCEAQSFVESGIGALGEAIEQLGLADGDPTSNSGADYFNNVFEIRSYYWGECECGWDELQYEGEHDADCYQVELKARRVAAHVDYDDEYRLPYDQARAVEDAIYDELTKKYGLPRAGCAVHCTCTYPQRWSEWFEANKLGPDGHQPTCQTILPNFRCGDFEARWYKYLGRGGSQNRELSRGEWRDIFEKCLRSVQDDPRRAPADPQP